MPDNYDAIGAFPTVQITGPATAVDVLRVTFRTKPSGIVAYANLPTRGIAGTKATDTAKLEQLFIEPLATGIERMMGSGQVAGATADEDTNASGLLIDYLNVIVAYESNDPLKPGPFQASVRIPVQAFDEPSFYGPLVGTPINDAYTMLQTLAEG